MPASVVNAWAAGFDANQPAILSLTGPTPAKGDVLVMVGNQYEFLGDEFRPDKGINWQTIHDLFHSHIEDYVKWRLVTETDPYTVFDFGTTINPTVIGMICLRGVDPTNPVYGVSAVTANPSSGGSSSAPAVTMAAGGDALVCAYFGHHPGNWTTPTGMVERLDVASPGSDPTRQVSAMAATQIASGSGALGPKSSTHSVDSWRIAVSFGLRQSPYMDLPVVMNFQPAGAEIPGGYSVDDGTAYSASRKYGWIAQADDTPVTKTLDTRDRNNAHADQRYDTMIHMQPGPASGTSSGIAGRWRCDVVNGLYWVVVGVGDQFFNDSTHRITANGVTLVNNWVQTATGQRGYAIGKVPVNDNRLIIDAAGGTNTKLDYLEIINMQPADGRIWRRRETVMEDKFSDVFLDTFTAPTTYWRFARVRRRQGGAWVGDTSFQVV